jgi:hypothetical protein
VFSVDDATLINLIDRSLCHCCGFQNVYKSPPKDSGFMPSRNFAVSPAEKNPELIRVSLLVVGTDDGNEFNQTNYSSHFT